MGTLNIDAPLELTMYDNDGHYAYAQGTLKSEKALHKPMDEKRLRDQLLKLGSTPFECDDINITIDEGITIPIKEINSVRRECCESLIKQRQMREKGRELDFEIEHINRKKTDIILTCEVSDEEQFKAAVKNNIKRIYVPNDLVGTLKDVPDDVEIISKSADIFCEENIKTDGVLVSSPAAIYKYKDKEIYGDFRLNVFNSQTAQHYGHLKTVTLSPELNLHEIADLCENTNANLEVIGYGHIPLMMMKNCPIKAMGKCQKGKMIYKLKDRKREEFPIVCSKGCIAKILNSKPIFMADKIADLKKLKINSIRLIFTVEKFAQCDKIIDMYKRALNGEKNVQSMTENFKKGYNAMIDFILASGSPRRKELLELMGLEFKVIVSQADEDSVSKDLKPELYVQELALLKASATAKEVLRNKNAVIISADTIVTLDGQILGKPKDEDDAFNMLSKLSGREHEVYTGYCVMRISDGKAVCGKVRTKVKFKDLSDDKIRGYINSGEPMDKAGAYGIQGLGSILIEKIDGDYFNVVGLPISALADTLEDEMDIKILWNLIL